MESPSTHELTSSFPSTVRLVDVKIRNCGEIKKLDAKGVALHCGDQVLLEVDGEVTYGVVYAEPYPAPFVPPMRMLKPILRKANQEESSLIARLERLSHDATVYCRAKAAEMRLRMKLVEVYGAVQRRQLTFVYTAEERIDFRELVRDLARRFGGRIEMRQVGVREEARRLGGNDTCGLTLCCASFLTDVKPVTVKQARSLGLPVEEPRLLGVCGRLKCCLMFEMMDMPVTGGRGLINPERGNRPPSTRPS
jgi:cell fate regulator YaaT (PSP1 superfamily)